MKRSIMRIIDDFVEQIVRNETSEIIGYGGNLNLNAYSLV
jgi:hypothetical protein